MRLRRLLPGLVFVLGSLTGFAQTTGGIVGTVTDSSGAVIPGVTLTLSGASLQGERTAATGDDGAYRFALLPPGSYLLEVDDSRFAPARLTTRALLGRDTVLDIRLAVAHTTNELVVVGVAPPVDTNSTSIGSNLDFTAITTLPTGRNYASIAQVVPGVASDANPSNPSQSTITVYGSSGAENAFYIDGVNTTNMEYGFQGKQLNFEFIQEVDVKTGGYEAEYGRSTGGIVNVITRSGGNELKGDVFGYYDADSLQSDSAFVDTSNGRIAGFTRRDFGADLGGYLLHDRLWFFAAYDAVDHAIDNELPAPQAGTIVGAESDQDLASLKLTWAVAPAQSLVATFLQDPRTDSGAIIDASHTLNGDASSYLGLQELGGRDYAIRYDAALVSNWAFTAQIARHEESNSISPATDAGQSIQYRDAALDFYQRGGFGLIESKEFERLHYAGSAMRLLGRHEVKGGLEFQHDKARVMKRMSGGQQVDIVPNPVTGGAPIYRHFYWTTPDATVTDAPTSALNSTPEHKVTTAYMQDRFTVTDRLVLSYGVRWDRQQIIDSSGVVQIDLKEDFAPRLGIVFNPGGTHRSRVFGSYGRFYEEIPMDLVIRSYSYERQPRIINYDPVSTIPDPQAEADLGLDSIILGGLVTPADPDLRNQYISEYVVGYEREVGSVFAVSIKGIHRSYGQVIEDFQCDDAGNYCIGNPGEGLMQRIYTLDGARTVAAPKAERTFRGVQLDATKRLTDSWQGMVSYLYSKLEGNFDGEYAPFTNVGADPNITAAYDYYDFFTDGRDLDTVTNRGSLSNDRRHQFKVSGSWLTPWKLSLGTAAYWRSGTPLTRYGYSDAYGRYEFFLTERGAEGRTPSNYDVDVHLGYPVALGATTLNFMLDVFNLLDTQRAILLDQRWAFQEADNAKATSSNPGYGEPVLRTAPRSVRFGVRLSF